MRGRGDGGSAAAMGAATTGVGAPVVKGRAGAALAWAPDAPAASDPGAGAQGDRRQRAGGGV
jgi:hypothetical protein